MATHARAETTRETLENARAVVKETPPPGAKATRAAWKHTLGADRWGRSQGRITHTPTPGPGWYDVGGAAARSRRRTALSSSFVSKTERKFLPEGSDAPGPAYYAPRRNRDSSFVLNDTGRWV